MSLVFDANAWIGLLTLTALEIVLGIDHIVFITILAGQMASDRRAQARRSGLVGALFTRLLLLASIVWIVRLTHPLATVLGVAISGRRLILIAGGLLLIGKATYEIRQKLEDAGRPETLAHIARPLMAVVLRMLALSFLVLIGTNLVAEGLGQHIPKGYTYFAMTFAVSVETLNLRIRSARGALAQG
ncbi:MAG: TerC family protein [Gemmatimonadaceae bacterium]